MIALSTIFSALLVAVCLMGIWQMVSHAWPKLSAALAGPVPAQRPTTAGHAAPVPAAAFRQAA